MLQFYNRMQHLVSEKLRIGFDAKRFFANQTGLGNYSRFVVQNLIRFFPEHQYLLYSPHLSGLSPDIASHARVRTPETWMQQIWPLLWRTVLLSGMLQNDHADVYHGLSNELPLGIGRFKGKKVVTIHDLIFLRYPHYYPVIDRAIYHRKFHHACRVADTIVATSNQTAQDIVDFYGIHPGKIKVIYQDCHSRFSVRASATECQRVRNTYQLPDTYLLSVGTHEPRKDQLSIIRAFARSGIKDAGLVLVGKETNYTQLLRKSIHELHLEGRVKLIHNIQPEDLPAVFQMARLFVYASEFEGFGIPVVEAMRSQVPVILAQTSSLTEVGADAAAYFKAGQTDELSGLFSELCTDNTKRHQMIAKGAENLTRFDAQKLSNELMQVYLG